MLTLQKMNTLKFRLTIFLLSITLMAQAQDNAVQMADTMRNNGKIYVVVAVLAVVLIGLFVYLFSLDKKIKNLEQKGSKEGR